jgi:NitT/TauT family transport system ATP-binding protein
VTLSYGEELFPILDEFSLDVNDGEFLVLLGPSGCGKTTALNLFAGLVRPSSGTASMNGGEIVGPGRERAVIFQGDDSLFHWLTVQESTEFPLKIQGLSRTERASKAEWALALTGLSSHRKKYPKELSGGMKQRLQLARALVCDTQLLLMDEPFGALDAFTRGDLQDQLIQIWQDTHKSIVFITHDIAEALILATRIAVMSPGPAATLQEVVNVSLPRPRSPGDPEFGALFEQIRSVLGRSDMEAAA